MRGKRETDFLNTLMCKHRSIHTVRGNGKIVSLAETSKKENKNILLLSDLKVIT